MFLANIATQVVPVAPPNEIVAIPVWLLLVVIAPLIATLFFFWANRGQRPGNSNRVLNAFGLIFIYAAMAGASRTAFVAGMINGAQGAEGRYNDHIVESGGTATAFGVALLCTLITLALFFILDQYIRWRIVMAVLFAVSALVLSRTSVEMQTLTDAWVYGLVQPGLTAVIGGIQSFFNGYPVWVQT